MAFVAYMYLEDHDSGKPIKGFTGEEDQTADGKSVKEMSRVQQIDHEITIPTDLQTGEATGPGHHKPFRVTMNMDRAVPMLYQYLTRAQRLNVKVHLFRSGHGERSGGKSDPHYNNWFTVTLEDARVVDMRLYKTMAMERDANIPDLVDVAFSYYLIKWEDHEDKVETEYKWKKKGKD